MKIALGVALETVALKLSNFPNHDVSRLSWVTEVLWEHRMPLTLTINDHEKAFSRVETNAISSPLVDCDVDRTYKRISEDCYRNCSMKVRLFHRLIAIATEI
ncbi:hypothetical protein KIN20_026137 [Parelaphostrongylus tenuis]|uniref:Uncharacterized protein n=1 Tax=Parelaphostrongylus tenuis TaxID=148309 RepID=A0AAD5N9J7_PARTN|nr:hypothetical protein KIN20_026137 [Parelaphostrongylus tenuis]